MSNSRALVTAEMVVKGIKHKYRDSGRNFIPVRECSICQDWIGYYLIADVNKLLWDSGCGCCSGSLHQEKTIDQVVYTINTQENDIGYNFWCDLFGIGESK